MKNKLWILGMNNISAEMKSSMGRLKSRRTNT